MSDEQTILGGAEDTSAEDTSTTEEQNSQSTDETKVEAGGEDKDANGSNADGEDQKDGAEGENKADEADKSDDEVPEAYAEFELPEGIELDEVSLGKATPLFKELGLSQEKAQKAVSLYADLMQSNAQAQAEAWADTQKEWIKTSIDDKEIGGSQEALSKNLTYAAKAIDRFGGDTLREVLDQTGMGNHPAFVKFFINLGKQIGEDGFTPNTSGEKAEAKDLAELMYPDAKN